MIKKQARNYYQKNKAYILQVHSGLDATLRIVDSRRFTSGGDMADGLGSRILTLIKNRPMHDHRD